MATCLPNSRKPSTPVLLPLPMWGNIYFYWDMSRIKGCRLSTADQALKTGVAGDAQNLKRFAL